MVKTLKFQDTQVPVPGLGCMSFSSMYGAADDSESKAALKRALDIGCTFWDTAAVYGLGHNEKLIGEFIKEHNCRDKLFIGSKCGFEIYGESGQEGYIVTNSPEHIAKYAEDSKERLGSYPDLYYLHRIDPKVPIEQSVAALQKLKTDGKIKYIGLSECSAATLRKACKVAHIDALQIEYSPWQTESETDGLFETAKEFGVTIVAYSPLGRGMLTGQYRSPEDLPADDFRRELPRWQGENFKRNLELADKFIEMAKTKGCTPSQLGLAWVIAQGCIPIAGTRRADRLEENFGGGNVSLSQEELKTLREYVDKAAPAGERYSEQQMAIVGH